MSRLRIYSAVLSAAVLALVGPGVAVAGFDVGDRAPRPRIAAWVQGEPIDFVANKGKAIYVLDFFSVSCPTNKKTMAYLNTLHDKYKDQGVVFISISPDGIDWITDNFLVVMKDKVTYRIAQDADGATCQSYLARAGAPGIPYTFVVGRDGRLAWHGYPDKLIEGVLADMVAGRFDVAAEIERRKQQEQLWAKFLAAARKADWDAGSALLGMMGPLGTYRVMAVGAVLNDRLAQDDTRGALICGKVVVEAMDDAKGLNEFAWDLLTAEELAGKHNELALIAARKAHELSKGKDYAIADTLARALFETGDVRGAVELQTKAVDMANEADDGNLDTYRETLERYKAGLEPGGTSP